MAFETVTAKGDVYDRSGKELWRGEPIAQESERFAVWTGWSFREMSFKREDGRPSLKKALQLASKYQKQGKYVSVRDRLIEGGK